jgi:hypothetical protein
MMNAGRLFSRHYVLVDYPLEKTKIIIVSDFDQYQQAEEAGPDRADPIRATDSARGKCWNVCDPLMCVISLEAWVLIAVHVRGRHPRW